DCQDRIRDRATIRNIELSRRNSGKTSKAEYLCDVWRQYIIIVVSVRPAPVYRRHPGIPVDYAIKINCRFQGPGDSQSYYRSSSRTHSPSDCLQNAHRVSVITPHIEEPRIKLSDEAYQHDRCDQQAYSG